MRRYPEKCICISEWDKPSFFLPSVYASNEQRWYADGRAETSHYLLSGRAYGNEWVTRFAQASVDKRYLYSFIGKSSSRVRKRLFRNHMDQGAGGQGDFLIEASDQAVPHFTYDEDQRRRYAEILGASKYALCPRGWGTSSVRLFEACEMSVAPVILAGRWVPVRGIDWTFAIFVGEKHVSDLDRIVRAHEAEWAERGQRARQTFAAHFAKDRAAQSLAAAISRLTSGVNPKLEARYRRAYPLIHLFRAAQERFRKWFPAYQP